MFLYPHPLHQVKRDGMPTTAAVTEFGTPTRKRRAVKPQTAVHDVRLCAEYCTFDLRCAGFTWTAGVKGYANSCILNGPGCDAAGGVVVWSPTDRKARKRSKPPMIAPGLPVFLRRIKPYTSMLAMGNDPDTNLHKISSRMPGGERRETVLSRNNAPLTHSELRALSGMFDATLWPDAHKANLKAEASRNPCRYIIPIRGTIDPQKNEYSFLQNEKAVGGILDALWKKAVLFGNVGVESEAAVNMGPSADGTLRSNASKTTCVTLDVGKESEGFGGQYFLLRMLVQYGAVHNMWYCHKAIRKLGIHTRFTNVSLSSRLMGFVPPKSYDGCSSCKHSPKVSVEEYHRLRVDSPAKDWMRSDGLLRIHLLSKAAQMQSKGLLDLSVCKFEPGR